MRHSIMGVVFIVKQPPVWRKKTFDMTQTEIIYTIQEFKSEICKNFCQKHTKKITKIINRMRRSKSIDVK